MLVTITQTFDIGARRYSAGESVDVDSQIARTWIADRKAVVPTAKRPRADRRLLRLRSALSKRALGIANATIFCVGDSTTFGKNANTGGANGGTTGARPLSWPVRLARYLNGHPLMGAVDANNNWNPNSADAVLTTDYDQRVTFGGGWLRLSSGGRMLVTGHCFSNQGADGDMVLTTDKAIDTIDFWTMDRSSGKSFEVLVNGVSVGTVNTATGSATAALVKHTLTFAAQPAGTITVRCASNPNNVSVAWINCYSSAQKQLTVVNCGWSGAAVSTFNADQGIAFGRLESVKTYNPDLVIFDLTINDALQLTPLSDYEAGYRALIANALAGGSDVMLVTGTPVRPDIIPQGLDLALNSINVGLAAEFGVPVLDMHERWGSYGDAHAVMPYYDSAHPMSLGYDDIARAVAAALLDLV